MNIYFRRVRFRREEKQYFTKDRLCYMPKVLRENKFSCYKCIKYQNVIFKLKKYY